MLEILEMNKENIKKKTGNYQCSDYIYEFLLNSGLYINAKDIISPILILLF